jgi:hypothetical protein
MKVHKMICRKTLERCQNENIMNDVWERGDRICDLVVRASGYGREMYYVSCEVQTEFMCYVEESRPPLWSSGQSSWLHNGDVLCFL